MRKNPKTSLRICQKVFEEKFQRKIGLGSIHRVMKNEKVGINLNTGIRKKAGFEKIFRINSLSEQISEAEESDRFRSTAHDADGEITNSEEMFVLEEIQNFDAINSGFSGLEIRNKKKTKQTSITSFFSKKMRQNCLLYLTCVI